MPDETSIFCVDSHTAGEPTRVVIDPGPGLDGITTASDGRDLKERRRQFGQTHDWFRSAVVREPRGSDVLVGALLCEPAAPDCSAGVIFFNNVGTLGMCGHGLIGLMVTLHRLGRIGLGSHRIDTPAGVVSATLNNANTVTLQNVPARRAAADVRIELENVGPIAGDVAWGGNWFFLVKDHPFQLTLAEVDALTAFTWGIRRELARRNITGDDGGEIDHIELFGPATTPGAHSRNFVLCPGKAYDRSPCGTGTSAKVACLIAAGLLRAGDWITQESIIGSTFEAKGDIIDGQIVPTLRGRAYVTAETKLLLNPADPFRWGISALSPSP